MIWEILFYVIGLIAVVLFIKALKDMLKSEGCVSCPVEGGCKHKTKELVEKIRKERENRNKSVSDSK
ncbi:hypothetical protein H6503_04405 [Candidatus Woesearchaeota archaeon]|nr:hypothetical protein [Candidatus Woesearchaeota archaeon]